MNDPRPGEGDLISDEQIHKLRAEQERQSVPANGMDQPGELTGEGRKAAQAWFDNSLQHGKSVLEAMNAIASGDSEAFDDNVFDVLDEQWFGPSAETEAEQDPDDHTAEDQRLRNFMREAFNCTTKVYEDAKFFKGFVDRVRELLKELDERTTAKE